jgi:uncharacterized protein (DUF1330 family)
MKTRYTLGAALVAGIGVGGSAIEVLHAQAQPPTYVIIPILKINDAATFKGDVVDKTAPDVLAAAGGHYVIRAQKFTSFGGGEPPERLVVLAFDSPEKALAWHNSPGQKAIDAARMKSTKSLSFMVEGFAN